MHLVKMRRPEPGIERKELKKAVNDVVEELNSYLDSFIPKAGFGYTKHAIMGPVGKLLGALESGRFESVDGYVGFTVNIHENLSKKPAGEEEIGKLRSAVSTLLDLKGKVGIGRWPKLIREIDYSVYYRRMEKIAHAASKSEGGE